MADAGTQKPDDLTKAPFELTDEEFRKVRDEVVAGGEDTDLEETPAVGSEPEDDTGSPKTAGPETPEQQATTELDHFLLEDEQPPQQPPAAGDEEDEVYQIKHRGQVHQVTRDKLIELAQKGFDYDVKVGPHGQIAELIQRDPGAAQAMRDYVEGRYNPYQVSHGQTAQPGRQEPQQPKVELANIDDYEDPNQWFQENMRRMLQPQQPQQQPGQPGPGYPQHPQRQPQQRPVDPHMAEVGNRAMSVLMARDPQHFQDVVGGLAPLANALKETGRMSQEAYDRINSGDIAALTAFYDYARPRILQNAQPMQPSPYNAPAPAAPRGNPTFSVKPGGGRPNREKGKDRDPWALSDKDFQAKLSDARGY